MIADLPDLNSRFFQTFPYYARKIRSAWCITVQANRVSAKGGRRAIDGDDLLLPDHANRARDHLLRVVDHAAGFAARGQRSVRIVGAIGEDFSRDGESRRNGGAQELRIGKAEEDERASDGHDRTPHKCKAITETTRR